MIGVVEVGGGDTVDGKAVCEIVVVALIKLGFRAEWVSLTEEFKHNYNLNVNFHKDKSGKISVTLGSSDPRSDYFLCECSVSGVTDYELEKWLEIAIPYLVATKVIAPE